MTDSFEELDKLARDLGEVPKNAAPLLVKAVEVTARHIKDDSQKSVRSGSRSWKAAAAAIDYDLTGSASRRSGSTLQAEIGYNKDRPGGPLGNLREFGAPQGGNHLAPHNDLLNAIQANQDDFERGLDKALRDAEGKAGL